ncbi:hypothetical protein ABZ131_20790 [Providencia rettgeri]
MSKKKKNPISDRTAVEMLEKGQLVPERVILAGSLNPKIKKFIDPKLIGCGKNNLPKQVCYTTHNEHHTHIYQADLTPILMQLFKDYQESVYTDLDLNFKELSNNLKLVVSFKSQSDIDEAYKSAKKTCNDCSVYVEKIIGGLTQAVIRDTSLERGSTYPSSTQNVPQIESFDIPKIIDMLNNNVRAIFSYIVLSFFKRKDELKKDPLIDEYINKFRELILELYKQNLAPYHIETNEDNTKTNMITFSNSVYSDYYFGSDVKTEKIESLLRYDSRFNGLCGFFDFLKIFIKNDNYNRSIKVDNVEIKDYRKSLADNLFDILEDIERLKQTKRDLEEIKDTKDPNIYNSLSFDKQTCEAP